MSPIQTNRQTVETLWAALGIGRRSSCLAPDIHCEDVPTEDPGARDPEKVVRRLRIAFDHLIDHEHTIHRMACEGDVVFLGHTEVWTFQTGEKVTNPFATLHNMKNGKVARFC